MFKLRLSTRLIVGLVAIPLFTLGLLIWQNTCLLNDSQSDSLQRMARQTCALVSTTLAPNLAANNRPALLATLEALRDDPALRYAGVFNHRRDLLASLGEPPVLTQDLTGEFRYRHTLSDGILRIETPIMVAGQPRGLVQIGYSTAGMDGLITRAGLHSAALALGGLLLSAVVMLSALRAAKGDLRRVEAGIQVLRRGEFEHRIAIDAPGAMTGVARAVDALAAYLSASQAEMRSHYERLLQESRRLNALLHGINAVVWEVDPRAAQFRYVSGEAERLSGYPPQEWLKADFCRRHVHPDDFNWVQGFLNHPGTASDSYTMDFRIISRDGECRWLRMISSVELRDQGPVLTGLLLNVTEEKHSEQRIAYLVDHDPLTGLINRRRFQERLDEQIAYDRRYNASGALLFIDLDQFKYINDTYGHHTGDEYLRQVAQHLRKTLRKTDIIGRLGGDEFGIILPSVSADSAEAVSAGLLKHLSTQEFVHEGRRTPFSASLGIVLFPTHGDKASELLAKADSAMYNAKDQGRNTYRLFEEGIDVARMQEKIYWEERIRQALREDRFQLYFQPIVDIHSGMICHYESLLRMRGDNDEVIAPGAFIGIAERFGMIRDIDRWVVENAIRIQGTNAQVGKVVALTINLSGRHFGGHEMLEVIQETTRRYKAVPRNIVFEVTETAAVENFADACDFIKALRDMGYRFALDDFGAGFASFDYLKHIPVDYVKIDGSFVRNLNRDKVDEIFVSAIADMARGLGVKAIAEFVENVETVEILKKLGVPLGQGYYFAKPSPRFHEHCRIILATGTAG